MSDLMRNQFEAWKGYPLPALDADGQYPKEYLQREWLAWKASRESLIVVLPERWYDGHGMPRVEPNGNWMDSTDVIDAIHGAGVKTK